MSKLSEAYEYLKDVYLNMVKNATKKYDFDDEESKETDNENANNVIEDKEIKEK